MLELLAARRPDDGAVDDEERRALTAILILTYGLYVPKSWRRAALVVGPLALLPFATLLVLYFRHPEAMGWLGQWAGACDTPGSAASASTR